MSSNSNETAVDPRVAAALSRADELASTSPEEHVAIYEEVHETLQQVLAEAGAEGTPAGAPPHEGSSGAVADSAPGDDLGRRGGDAET